MRIGIDIRHLQSSHRTGVGEYTVELLTELFERPPQHEYILFANGARHLQARLPQWHYPHVRIVYTRIPNKLLNVSIAAFRLPTLDGLMREELDVFFSPNLNFVALGERVRHVLTIHDLSFEHFPHCFTQKQRLWHALLRPKEQAEQADRILTPSHATAEDVVRTFDIPESRVCVVPFGISRAFAQSAVYDVHALYGVPNKYILFLGTIEPRKNIASLIEAFLLSQLAADGYHLVIAGAPGWKSGALLHYIEGLQHVTYIGYVDAAHKPSLYRGAAAFVYPSLFEGYGFPVLEALSMGTPVVTSSRSSLPEVAAGRAILVNPMYVHEIASGMRQAVRYGKRACFLSPGWRSGAAFLEEVFEHLST